MQLFVAEPHTQIYMLHILGHILQALPGSINSQKLESIQPTDDIYVCLLCCTSQPWAHLDRIGGLKQAFHDISNMQRLCKSLDGIT